MKTNKFLVFLMALLLASCNNINNNSQNEDSIIIKDLINREISINPGSYKRVVCIGAGALRLYSYIGDINLLCGVEDIDNESLTNRPKMFDSVARPYFIAYKDVFKTLPSCGVGGPNNQFAEAEKILSCNPDIVISEYEDVTKEDALQKQLGVPVITLRYGSKGVFDENLSKSLTLLGKIFNKEDRATSLNNYILKEKNDISTRVKNVSEESKKNVYICGLGNWGTTNELMTSSNYEPFNVANIKNVLSDIKQEGNFKIEKEKFISIGEKIDVMFIDAAAVKNIKPEYNLDNEMFSFVKAFNNNEVYLQMAYNAYYTNVELALVNTWFNAICVYPTLFNDIKIDDKLNEVTKEFLNMEMKNEIYSYANSFNGYQKIDVNTFFN
ncbi:MAG: ABC transporter substrate-binding protein [Candidatus Caccosoma sp.]|nr:ABC transporter substrate-binding protein [Candidatus Caccosoma sp.]